MSKGPNSEEARESLCNYELSTQGSAMCPGASKTDLDQSDGISVSSRTWRVPGTLQRVLCHARNHHELTCFENWVSRIPVSLGRGLSWAVLPLTSTGEQPA